MQLALYYANVTVGTPSQNLRLHIDTGSSDMWVNTPNSQICQYRRGPCSSTGTYNANTSSTYKYVNSDFNVSYADGSGAAGDYATDNVGIGGTSLSGLQFGIGYDSATPEGILGIGYEDNESQNNRNGQQPYANMPQAMVNVGLIKTNAYSIWLDDLESSTGSILFGGVDTNKYTGSLQTLPVQKERGSYQHFIITLTGLTVSSNGQNTNLSSSSSSSSLPTPVILDTGSTISYLPDTLVQTIFQTLNVQYSSREGTGYTSCSLAQQTNVSLTFTFGGSVNIRVNISELVINPSNADTGSGSPYDSQDSLCIFGITSTGSNSAVLGDTFLRSAYVVFDLDNNEVGLAQTNFESSTGSTNVQEITAGDDGVPGASAVSDPVEASATQTGGSRVVGSGAATGSARSAGMRSAVVLGEAWSSGVWVLLASCWFVILVLV